MLSCSLKRFMLSCHLCLMSPWFHELTCCRSSYCPVFQRGLCCPVIHVWCLLVYLSCFVIGSCCPVIRVWCRLGSMSCVVIYVHVVLQYEVWCLFSSIRILVLDLHVVRLEQGRLAQCQFKLYIFCLNNIYWYNDVLVA